MDPEFTAQNPIVAAAERIRARRDLHTAVDSAAEGLPERKPEDAEGSLRLFIEHVNVGAKRLNSILGRDGVKVVSLERPLRLRVRFRDLRAAFELDDVHQLVRVSGLDLDGEYQFDPGAPIPALVNVSKLSTEAGYGDALTPSSLLKTIAQDAQLPRPSHLGSPGPLSF
jgi:hypothetical protein